MLCKSCGRKIAENSVFCNWCGVKQIKTPAQKRGISVPEPRLLPSGKWFIQLRPNGKSISITEDTAELCRAKAQAYKAGIIETKKSAPARKTPRMAIDEYIENRYNILSPSTIRGYRAIQRKRFALIMDKPINSIKNWQRAIDDDAKIYAPKTVINAWGFLKTVLADYTDLPKVRLPQKIKQEPKFLRPEQIPVFVKTVACNELAVPVLLALSSMRISEIKALQWEDIDADPEYVRVSGAVVLDEHDNPVRKKQTKTFTSTRNVPILIPELREALIQHRSFGPIMTCHEVTVRRFINKTCADLGFDRVGIHGLRHSFASLAYHLGIPEKIAMEIGGWGDEQTMRRIYTHVAESDISRYKNEMLSFYQNA